MKTFLLAVSAIAVAVVHGQNNGNGLPSHACTAGSFGQAQISHSAAYKLRDDFYQALGCNGGAQGAQSLHFPPYTAISRREGSAMIRVSSKTDIHFSCQQLHDDLTALLTECIPKDKSTFGGTSYRPELWTSTFTTDIGAGFQLGPATPPRRLRRQEPDAKGKPDPYTTRVINGDKTFDHSRTFTRLPARALSTEESIITAAPTPLTPAQLQKRSAVPGSTIIDEDQDHLVCTIDWLPIGTPNPILTSDLFTRTLNVMLDRMRNLAGLGRPMQLDDAENVVLDNEILGSIEMYFDQRAPLGEGTADEDLLEDLGRVTTDVFATGGFNTMNTAAYASGLVLGVISVYVNDHELRLPF